MEPEKSPDVLLKSRSKVNRLPKAELHALQFAGVVAQMQAGVGKTCRKQPTTNLNDALMHAFLHAAASQAAKGTGLDPTFPNFCLCDSTNHQSAKIFGLLTAILDRGTLNFIDEAEADKGVATCEEMAILPEVEVVLLDIGRSVLFSHSLPRAFKATADGRSLPMIGHVYRNSADIYVEGTVCPISFVKDVLYPYSVRALPNVLATQWDSPTFARYRNGFPEEHRSSPEALSAHFTELVSRDVKTSYFKDLQGYLWVEGYESGEIRCPLFPDVHPSFLKWQQAGIPIVIYSSGSVAAQKLLFEYTNSKPDADVRPLISGYFDTVNAGMKKDASSYQKIAASRREDISRCLFLSDRVEEVEAAKEAGMQSLVVVRDGNAPLGDEEKKNHELITSFEEIKIVR